MALITREALKHKEFQKIFSTKDHKAKRDKNNYFINKNKTLWEYQGGDGGKTGYTMAAGRCLVSTTKRNGMRLIAVSLNARNWFQDNYKLFDYGFENYKPNMVYCKGQKVKDLSLQNASNDLVIITKEELLYPLTDSEKNLINNIVEIEEDLRAPIKKGNKVGTIKTYLNGVLIKNGDLLAGNDVMKLNIIKQLIKSIKD